MPMINRNLDSIENKLAKLRSRWWKRIKATLTLPVQQHLLRFSVLNQEEKGWNSIKVSLSRVKRWIEIRFLLAEGTWRTLVRVRGWVVVGIMEVPIQVMPYLIR
jgi:hypothetical protein